jgi:hypothetical protein
LEWTLLVLKDATGHANAPTDGFAAAANALGVELKVVYPEDGETPDLQGDQGLKSLIDLYEAPLVLIRPDHIVAWRGTSDGDAAQVMRQVLGWGG